MLRVIACYGRDLNPSWESRPFNLDRCNHVLILSRGLLSSIRYTGISLDVTDTRSTWVSVKGWVTSSEGGIRWVTNIAKFLGILILT